MSLLQKINEYLRRKHPGPIELILGLMLIMALVNAMPVVKNFPDYEAYRVMYEEWDFIPNINWGPVYIFINRFFKFLGLNYGEFRVALYLLSTSLFWVSVLILKKKFYKNEKFNIFQLLVILVSIEFFIEFYLIRVRAGVAISLATFAISLFLTTNRLAIPLALLGISYFLHSFSTVVLGVFLIPAFLALKNIELRFNIYWVFIGFIVIYLIELSSAYRGLNAYSKLNTYRFLAISPITILFFIINHYLSNKEAGSGIFDKYINNTFCIYMALISGVFVAFIMGIINNSGEGLLRILYVFNVVWILALLLSRSRYRLTVAYIALVNAAFFVYSVFLR